MVEGVDSKWYATVEQAKMKANKLINQVVAVNQSTSFVVGKLKEVEIDSLWQKKMPYCRLSLEKPQRFRDTGKFECALGDIELFFVNKPGMIFTIDDLETIKPELYREIRGRIKKGEL